MMSYLKQVLLSNMQQSLMPKLCPCSTKPVARFLEWEGHFIESMDLPSYIHMHSGATPSQSLVPPTLYTQTVSGGGKTASGYDEAVLSWLLETSRA